MEYKVGDKVRIKSLDWYNENKDEYGNIDINYNFTFYADRSKYCGKVVTISEVLDIGYSVKEDNDEYYWADEMIECKVEDTIITNEQLFAPCNISLEKEMEWNLPQGYIFKDENGNVINATKIVLEKKKKEYPKTYEECCKIIDYALTGETIIGYKTSLLRSFQKLLVCRDAYWKIAGDEMELGKPWEPDWKDDTTHKFIIHTIKDKIHCGVSLIKNHLLAFPTEEMRDAFYENFKSEIESCKELL